MTKFRIKLLLTVIALLVGVLISIGLILGQFIKTYHLNTFDERLNKESKLIAAYIEDHGGIETVNQNRVKEFSGQLNARISVVDTDGNVLYDSGELAEENNKDFKKIISDIIGDGSIEQDRFQDTYIKYYGQPIFTNEIKTGYVLLSTEMEELKEANTQVWWFLAISFAFGFIVIIILGLKIMTRYTRPIERATAVAFELAKGNYETRTFEDQAGEIGMLSSSLNILARNLQDMKKAHEIHRDRLSTLIENMGSGLILIDDHGYISMINRTFKEIFDVKSSEFLYKVYYEVIEHKGINKIIEDIFMTEQKVKKQIVVPLKIQRRHFEVYGVPIIGKNDVWKGILLVFHDITELKRLEQMRKDFVANVSHELKTPVTSIKGFSETLLDGAMEDRETLESFLTIMLKESGRLQSLINDLLELSKIENEGFNLSIQEINMIIALEDAINILDGKAKDKDISIVLNELPDSLMMEGDISRIKQVFINIISNAVSYTPQGGNIFIQVEQTAKKVIIHIKDSGLGIEEEEIPRIFERFYRVNKARDRNTGGTGLGLAIVKHLMEAHKGKISVHSEIGIGTTFSIELNKKFPKN